MRLQFFGFLSAAALFVNVDIKVGLGSPSASVGHLSDVHKLIVFYLASLYPHSLPAAFLLPACQLESFSGLFMRLLPLLFVFLMLVDLLKNNIFLLNVLLSLFPLLVPDQLVDSLDLLFVLFDL